MQATDTITSVEPIESAINWSSDAPRGGRTVLNRILKENAAVPLFFAQTLISSLRDVGYNHTTSALCEHVDNAIEAGVRISAIVDGHFSLIVDSETAPSEMRWGSAQVLC